MQDLQNRQSKNIFAFFDLLPNLGIYKKLKQPKVESENFFRPSYPKTVVLYLYCPQHIHTAWLGKEVFLPHSEATEWNELATAERIKCLPRFGKHKYLVFVSQLRNSKVKVWTKEIAKWKFAKWREKTVHSSSVGQKRWFLPILSCRSGEERATQGWAMVHTCISQFNPVRGAFSLHVWETITKLVNLYYLFILCIILPKVLWKLELCLSFLSFYHILSFYIISSYMLTMVIDIWQIFVIWMNEWMKSPGA